MGEIFMEIAIKSELRWLYKQQTKQTLRKKFFPETKGHYSLIKGSVHLENIAIINIHTCNRAPK